MELDGNNHLSWNYTNKVDEEPKLCFYEGGHPENYLGCPENLRNTFKKLDFTIASTLTLPTANFLKQRTRNDTISQQLMTNVQIHADNEQSSQTIPLNLKLTPDFSPK
ncbi:hypothetical protein TNCV_408091 [Trichonephila clavipes]|nr:hypothetical protein TNCV_408091 [Trichonephila clavipes]